MGMRWGDFTDGARTYLSRSALVVGMIVAAVAPVRSEDAIASEVDALVPDLEAYIQRNIEAFDSPGLAIGIVTGDRLVFASGYGTRSRGGEAVDPETIFQIGSTTKAFLATTMAIGVDRELFGWNDRVVELDPEFAMNDPWVTHEFRVADLLAQRSGMPPSANDIIGLLGSDRATMVNAMRHVEPVSSFRSTFSYTNVTHILADQIVARAFGVEDWNAVAQRELLDPLGMDSTSFTAEAISSAANHAEGHRWHPAGSVQVPFTPVFPYNFGGAGNMNSNIDDMARWVRFQLRDGVFEGERLVSAGNLSATRMARVGLDERRTYASGWMQQATPNGRIIWHNGGTTSFGAFVGFAPDHDIGVIVLTNLSNIGLPDAVGLWTLNRLLGNPDEDLAAPLLANAKAGYDEGVAELEAARAKAVATPDLGRLAGDYEGDAFGSASVAIEPEGLRMTLENTGAVLLLEDLGAKAFSVTLEPAGHLADIAANLGPAPIGGVVFEAGEDGEADGFRFTTSDNGQHYDFRRKR